MAVNFRDKYLQSGPVTCRLIDGFFASVARLVEGLPEPPRRILEVGCGEGHSTRRLSALLPSGHYLEASDVTPELVDAAKRNGPSVRYSVESAYGLARPDRAVDMVIALEVLEHLERPAAALAELHRVTNRWVLLSVPREPLFRSLNMVRGRYLTMLGNTPGHLQHWSTRAFSRFVATRFRVSAVATPVPWTIILAERLDA
jgi:2-polyprenyl-3-methyl-5-hydroxy-6-metoxy-1,4-benzoquinol methylase